MKRIKGIFELKRSGDGTYRIKVATSGTQLPDNGVTGDTIGAAFEKALLALALRELEEDVPEPQPVELRGDPFRP